MPADILQQNKKEKDNNQLSGGQANDKEQNNANQNTSSNQIISKLLELFNKYFKHVLMSGVVISLLVLLVVSNIVTGSVSFLLSKSHLEKKYLAKEGILKSGKFIGSIYYLSEQTYSLAFNGNPMYLKLNICVELQSDEMIDEVREKYPRLMNIISEVITNKPLESFTGLSGMQYARRLMMESINRIFETGHIVDIYFIEYNLIQKADSVENTD